jgi:methyl-accepting chemotaxis protein
MIKVATVRTADEFGSFRAEAEKSLNEVKQSQETLEKLAGGDKMTAYDELSSISREILTVTEARLKAEASSEAVNKNVTQQMRETSARLATLDNNIRKLQSSRASAYVTSMSTTQTTSNQMRDIEAVRLLLKDMQLAMGDITKATGRSALLIAKGKMNAGVTKSLQNNYLKANKNLANDIKAFGDKVEELIKAQTAYVTAVSAAAAATPPGPLPDKAPVDTLAREVNERLASSMLAIEQEVNIASEKYGMETNRQGDIFNQSSTATTILAGNSELVNLGISVEGLSSRLFTVGSENEVAAIEAQIGRIYQNINSISGKLAAALKKVGATKEIGILNSATASLNEVRNLIVSQNGVTAAVRNKMAMERQAQQAMEKMRQIVLKQAEKGKQTVTTAQGDQEKAIATVNKMVRFSILLILAIGAGAIVFGIVFGGWIYRSIAKPLHRLITASDEVAHGNLQAHLAADSNDEVGQVQNSVGKMVEALRDVVDKIRTATDNLASNSEELSATAAALEKGSLEQSSRIEQSATAMTEMNQTTMEVARNSSDTSDAAGKMKVIAEQGKSIMHQSVQELEAFAGTVREAAEKVESLGAQSEEINNVVILIKDIADQTNLLALNAAIEAARAGEQGRGFAVVADNVRQLAERTTQATDEIAQTVKSMQSSVADSVKFMQSERQSVDKVMEGIRNTLESIDQMVQGVEQVSDMVQRIAVAAEQQSSTSEEITQNMTSISEITHELRKSFEQINNSSQGLSQLASDLNSTVSWFKVA